MKKLIPVLFAAVLVVCLFSLLPEKADAATYSGTCGDGVNWNLNTSTGVLSITGSGAMSDYYNTAPWEGYKTHIKSATISDSVTSIGDLAFYGCTGLTSITIGNSVTRIGEYAFFGCTSLTSITIPSSVASVEYMAFYNCMSLTTITIPNSVTIIESGSFQNCKNLSSIRIPNDVISIGKFVFDGCDQLQYNEFHNAYYLGTDSNPYYALISVIDRSVNFFSIHPDAKVIAGGAFEDCTALTSIMIPEGVITIGESAFYNCSGLASVTLPNNLIRIECCAFAYCTSLSSITIPSSVELIESNSFAGCTSLKRVDITDLTKWCEIDFSTPSQYSYYFVNPLTQAHKLYLNGVLVRNLVVPDEIKKINPFAFSDCRSLKSVVIPEGVTSIGHDAFYSCENITSITLPESLTSVGSSAFAGCANLSTVYYRGTPDRRETIKIGSTNTRLTKANWVYLSASSISVCDYPAKTEYTVNDAFLPTGLHLSCLWEDGVTTFLMSGFTVSEPDMTTPGVKTVTVSYRGKSAIFEIRVLPDPASLRITGRTLIFDSTFTVRYLLEKSVFDAYLDAGMTVASFTVSVDGGATRDVSAVIGSDQVVEIDGVDYYWIKVTDIAPKRADLPIRFSLSLSHCGNLYSDSYDDSVKAALEKAASSESSAFSTAANATLAYCAAAAATFGGDPMGEFTPVADITGVPEISTYLSGSGILRIQGTSLILKDELSIRFWAKKGSFSGGPEEIAIRVNGVETEAEKEEQNSYFIFKISVPIFQMKTAMTVELFVNGISVSNRYTDSVLNCAVCMTKDSYGFSASEKALGQAIVNYILYSNAYLSVGSDIASTETVNGELVIHYENGDTETFGAFDPYTNE